MIITPIPDGVKIELTDAESAFLSGKLFEFSRSTIIDKFAKADEDGVYIEFVKVKADAA